MSLEKTRNGSISRSFLAGREVGPEVPTINHSAGGGGNRQWGGGICGGYGETGGVE